MLLDLWTIWLAVAIIFLIIEMLGPNLVSIWFSIAAFIMAPLSLLKINIPIQIAIFLVLSMSLMIPLRKIYEKKIKPKNILKDNLGDKTISETGIVTKEINNSKNEGQIIIGDVYWNAISTNESIIKNDSKVIVDKIENMKVYVSKI